MNLGKWEIDDYLTFVCNTHKAEDGAATDADAAPTYRVYEDETGAAILTGSLAKLDDANTVGFYSERIQLTAANGFENGKAYTIYITATVDSVAGTMSHSFQVDNALSTIDTVVDGIKAVTDNLPNSGALTDIDTGVNNIEAKLPTNYIMGASVQAAMDDEINAIKAKTDNLPADPAAKSDITSLNDPSAAAIADAVWDEAAGGHTGAGSFGEKNQKQVPSETLADYKADVSALATAADLATVDTVVDAIKIKTDNLPADPAATSDITGLNDLSSADVQTIIENNDLDHLAKVAHPSGDPAKDSLLDLMMNKGASQTFDRTADSLEALSDSTTTPPSAAAIADAVWEEAAADHTTGTSFGGKNQKVVPSETLNDYKADISALATAADLTTVDGNVDAIKAVTDNLPDSGSLNDLAAIKTKTDNLPADPAAQSDITGLNDLSSTDIQTIIENNDLDHLAKVAHPSGDPTKDSLFDLLMNKDASQTYDRSTDSLEGISDTGGGGPTAGQIADAVWDEAISGHVGAGSFGAKNQKAVPSETIADYKADVSSLATSAALATVDTVVDAIKAVTDNLPDSGALNDLGQIKVDTTAILADTNELQGDWTNGGRLDLILDAVKSDTAAILVDTGTTIPATLTTISDDLDAHDTSISADISDLTDDVADVKSDTGLILAAVGGGPPAGAITWTYNVTNQVSGQPIADVDVWVTTDVAGVNVIANGKTDQNGNITFYLDAGTVYVWSQKTGFNFDNPDTEVIS
jgi:hypothetical protein